MYKEKDPNLVVEQQADIDTTKEFEESDDILLGMVTGCEKLNVRTEPSPTAAIVCEIDRQTEVLIEEAESTEDFYKVCTASGVDGFCMRKFIKIQS